MKIGVGMFPTEYSIGIVQLARAVEEHGFESLFLPEHTHIPASRKTPFPSGGELPREYSHSLDPFVALGAAAAVTARLRLGTGVCLVIERDPITLAKEVASLDYIAAGRVLFGIGGGWNLEEMEHHGTDPAQRWRVLRERVLAMKQIWSNDEAEYHGRFVNFDPIWQWPKPVQRPHPPILVGGNGPRTLQRVVEYGDGWMPIVRPGMPVLDDRIAELRRLAEQVGRGPIPITLWSPPRDLRLLEHYQELGVERVVFGLSAAPAEAVLPRLEHYAELLGQFS